MVWTTAQQMAIAIAPKVSGMLSLIGSCCIIYDIVCFQLRRKDRKHNTTTTTCNDDSSSSSNNGHTGCTCCCTIAASLLCCNTCRANFNNRLSQTTSTFTSILATSSAHHRIILGMSISDCIITNAHFFSTWPIPKDSDDDFPVYGNIGNTGTCTAQGFFIQLGIMVPLYNAFLVLYFLLTIRRGWTEAQFQKVVGPLGHTLIWFFGLGTASVGLYLTLYNNAMVWCWISSEPQGCTQSFQPPPDESDFNYDETNEEPCDRGDNAFIYRFAFWYGPLWLIFPWVVIGMTLVYLHVLRQDKKMESYLTKYTDKVQDMQHEQEVVQQQQQQMQHMQEQKQQQHMQEQTDQVAATTASRVSKASTDGIRSDTDDDGDDRTAEIDRTLPPEPSLTELSTTESDEQRIERRQRQLNTSSIPQQSDGTSSNDQVMQICNSLNQNTRVRSRAVALQGIFYMLVFLAINTFPTVVRSMQLAEKEPHWSIFFLFTLLKPLQGLMNWFVYFRPRLFPVSKKKSTDATTPIPP